MAQGAPRRLSLRGPARLLVGAALGLALGFGLWLLRDLRLVRGLEGQLLDLRTRHFAGAQAPDPDIVLVQVEESDVQEVARDLSTPWPWPLDLKAVITDFFADVGVRGLVLDSFQFDRGAGPDDISDRREAGADKEQAIDGEAELAVEYAKALRKIGGVPVSEPPTMGRVVLAFQLTDDPRYDAPARLAAAQPRLDTGGVRAPEGAYARPGANFPVSRVTAGVKLLGFAGVEPDPDGVIRRAYVAGRMGTRSVPSLALAGALLFGDARADAEGRLVVGGRTVRTNADGSFLVDFRAPRVAAAYARVRPAKVLEWQIAAAKNGGKPPAEAVAALKGKIVIWGVNIGGHGDVVPTAIDPVYDGPELQATILDNLLHGGERVHATSGANLAWTLAVAGAMGVLTLLPRGRRLPHVLGFLVLAATVGAGFLVFGHGTALDLFVPLVAGVLTWGATTAFTLLTEGRYNKWLESTFSRYLAPSVIDALKRDPALLQLGGTTREVTVLFSDIAGFTTISEQLDPPQVAALLQHYLTPHCDAVFAQDGVVDKFIGDAVVAFYGDPIPQPDHALRACRTALDVQAALPRLEPVWRGMGLKQFHVRIGLNSGRAVVGNMGSAQRFNYTALGDTVNLASRLEGANKAFGTRILLGEATRLAAGDAVLAKSLGRLVVVGKEEPVGVYELVALSDRATPADVRHVEAFDRATAAAKSGDLSRARAALAEAEALKPGDGACAWFSALLGRLASGAEPTPWSGVVTLTGK